MDILEDPSNRIDAEASTSSNEPPSLKKRKLSDDELSEREIDKEIIYGQIHELHEGRRLLKNVKDELERMKKVETELQSKIVVFEEQKKITETEFAKLKSDMHDQLAGLKKENEEKDEKIKELQLLAKDIKPDPDHVEDGKTKDDKINELQTTCESREKKIKELEAQLQSKATTEISLRDEMSQIQQNNDSKTKLLQSENDRLKATVEEQNKKLKGMDGKLAAEVSTVAQLEFELEEMKKCYKTDLLKNEEDKKALKNEHDKKMADMKAEMRIKIDNEKNEHATAINQLNATNEDLMKKILSENQEAAAQYQNKIKELNDKITVSKKFNIELHSENEELKQKERDARAKIFDREKQIQDLQNMLAERAQVVECIVDLDDSSSEEMLVVKSGEDSGEESDVESDEESGKESDVESDEESDIESGESGEKSDEENVEDSIERIVDLDELCDDSRFRYDRLLGRNNLTVIKIGKLEYYANELTICSERSNRKVRLSLLDFIENVCRFQVNGECNWNCIQYMRAIMPIITSWNLKKIDLANNTMECEVFMKFISSHTITTFIGGSVKRENGEMLEIDEIFKELPNIEICEMKNRDISKNECKNLAKLPTFSNLRHFTLYFTKTPPDLLCFASFIKKHQNAEFTFNYYYMSSRGQKSVSKKVQKLREILPSNCKVSKTHHG